MDKHGWELSKMGKIYQVRGKSQTVLLIPGHKLSRWHTAYLSSSFMKEPTITESQRFMVPRQLQALNFISFNREERTSAFLFRRCLENPFLFVFKRDHKVFLKGGKTCDILGKHVFPMSVAFPGDFHLKSYVCTPTGSRLKTCA